jgi:Pup amidohydrolase
MQSILAGIETEYGLLVEGRGPEEQIDDAIALVRGYPGECFASWDYRYESPRADLRGFNLKRLAFDPEDAKFDAGRTLPGDRDMRSDRILPNGARFYNDHGHPEYSTPECWSTAALALHDKAGEIVVLRAAEALATTIQRDVRVYKNNTDYHGASYGTHENYLIPRSVGFERLYHAVLPMLVARTVLCGAGKVGAEHGPTCTYQLSQRADFFAEPVNAETLFRRPIFNTRDEPHASHAEWIRLHVISGDANMIAGATARKVGLIKLAVALAIAGEAPVWRLQDPVAAFQAISRDETYEFRIDLAGGSWTTAYNILESYFAAAETVFGLHGVLDSTTADGEAQAIIKECRDLLDALRDCPERLARSVDWAAKKSMLEEYMQEESTDWRDPILRNFDLEYHNIDPSAGLHAALEEMEVVMPAPSYSELEPLLQEPVERNRAWVRSLAVRRFPSELSTACWRSLTFEDLEVELLPDMEYPQELQEASNVETFIRIVKGVA